METMTAFYTWENLLSRPASWSTFSSNVSSPSLGFSERQNENMSKTCFAVVTVHSVVESRFLAFSVWLVMLLRTNNLFTIDENCLQLGLLLAPSPDRTAAEKSSIWSWLIIWGKAIVSGPFTTRSSKSSRCASMTLRKPRKPVFNRLLMMRVSSTFWPVECTIKPLRS